MSPAEGAAELGRQVTQIVNEKRHKIMSKGYQAQNSLRAHEKEVLTNHSPSSPGMPPGVRTGALRGTWNFGMSGGGDHLIIYGEPTVKYAEYLERGTHSKKTGKVKMERRPYVTRITEKVRPRVMSIFSSL